MLCSAVRVGALLCTAVHVGGLKTCKEAGKEVSVQTIQFSGLTGGLLGAPSDLLLSPPSSVYVLQPGGEAGTNIVNFTDGDHCDDACPLTKAVPAASAPPNASGELHRFHALPTRTAPDRFLMLFKQAEYTAESPPVQLLHVDGRWSSVGLDSVSCFPAGTRMFRECRAMAVAPDGKSWALVGNGDFRNAHPLTRIDLTSGICTRVDTSAPELAMQGRAITAAAYSRFAGDEFTDGAVFLTLETGTPQVLRVNVRDWSVSRMELDAGEGGPLGKLLGVAAGGWNDLGSDDDAQEGGGQRTLAIVAEERGESGGELWTVPAAGGLPTRVAAGADLGLAAAVYYANPGEGDAMYVAHLGAGPSIVRVCATTNCGCGADTAAESSSSSSLAVLAVPLILCAVALLLFSVQKARQNALQKKVLRSSLGRPLLFASGAGGGGVGAVGGVEESPRVDYVLGCSAGEVGDAPGSAASFRIAFPELEMDRVVGMGSWGRVYAGRFHGAPVAIKELLGFSGDATAAGTGESGSFSGRFSGSGGGGGGEQEDGAKAQKLFDQFSKEARILMSLHHEAIIEFFGLSENPRDGMLYIVTEFCELDLGKLLERGVEQRKYIGACDRATWLDLANQICSGMRYLHSKGIIHRDLKPDNVLLRPTAGGDGEAWAAKICDFGISKHVGGGPADALSATHTRAAGTPLYMAPEVMRGSKGDSRYSGKADVYSFGVTLWSMWSGDEPFADVGGSLLQLMMAIVKGDRPPFDPPGSWPLGVQLLLDSCWAAEPADRPNFADLQEMMTHDALFGEGGGGGAAGTSEEAAAARRQSREASGRGALIEMQQASMLGRGGGLSAAWSAAAGAGISMGGVSEVGSSRRSVSNLL